MLYLARSAINSIKYYVKRTSGFTITPVIVRAGGAGTATWDWGDGSATETGDSMSHAYDAGTYTVTLTLTDIPTALTSIDVSGDYVVGDFLGCIRTCKALTVIIAHTNTGLMTNCSRVSLQWWPALTHLYLSITSVSGDISGWTLLASLSLLSLNNTSVEGAPTFTSAVALRNLQYHDCALAQATVDAILLAMYNRRASFTYASPAANLGGTNDDPSGVYQDATPPTTGLEYKYKLVVDPDAEGFNKWVITT